MLTFLFLNIIKHKPLVLGEPTGSVCVCGGGGSRSLLQSLETRTAGQVGEASLTGFLLCPALSWALRLDTFLRVGEAGEKVPRAPETSW